MKRSGPPARRTPLQGTGGPPRVSELRRTQMPRAPRERSPAPRTRPADTGPTPETRAAVYARDEQRCRRCGRHAEGGSVQHRRARGKGGTSREDVNEIASLVLLCGSGTTLCHGHVEGVEREQAYEDGWLIRSYDPRPASAVPIRPLRGPALLLLDDGTVREVLR